MKTTISAALALSCSAAVACKGGAAPEKKASVAAAAAAPSVAPAPKPVQPGELPAGLRVPSAWPIPTGPRLAILAGQGVGPIRIGATVATIERLMDLPCEVRTPEACRYIGRAVEFTLKDGVTTEIHVHRVDRPTDPKPRVFGVFNGRTPEGLSFFMLPAAEREMLGPPLKVTPAPAGSEWNTVEIHHYKGMRVEFDRIPNGNLVVGGFVIFKEPVK